MKIGKSEHVWPYPASFLHRTACNHEWTLMKELEKQQQQQALNNVGAKAPEPNAKLLQGPL
jgi:hypothetical protein